MSVPRRTGRALMALLFGLALGLALAGALFYAHVSGRLTSFYHKVGLHSLVPADAQHQAAGQSPTGPGDEEMEDMPGMPGMKMPKRKDQADMKSAVSGYAVVKVTPERQQLIGVRTGKVERDKLLMFIRAVGIVEPDQARLSRVQTRISGWVTKVHANFVGQNVKKGDPLLEIYSPDLLATQEEYLLALEGGQKPLAESARRRLELWGVPQDELKELEKTKKARETLTLRATINGRILERNALEGTRVEPTMDLYRLADLSVVWLQAKIYEYELPHIEIGEPVRISFVSRPEVELQSKVAFVEPVLQETTRTVKVRIVLDNPKDEFRPGMFANLRIEHDMGEGLLAPESAFLRTGERNLAFRVLPEGRFEPVEVKMGARFGERFQVLDGLAEGDEIVTSAVFLIDAESRLKSSVAGMSGHQHGSSGGKSAKSGDGHQHGSESPPAQKPQTGHQHDAPPAKSSAPTEHHHDHGK